MKLAFSPQIFEESSRIKFHNNQPSEEEGGGFVARGQKDERTHMTKLTVAFPKFCERALTAV